MRKWKVPAPDTTANRNSVLHKHMIIKGGYGCGKTVIAAAMLKKISESLRNDEKLYYICYDTRTELLSQKRTSANITPVHNKE